MIERRAYEEGHQPKLLIIIDDSSELEAALLFAGLRAKRLRAAICGLGILHYDENVPRLLGVDERLHAEAEERLKSRLEDANEKVKMLTGESMEQYVRVGTPVKEIIAHIEEDEDIALLVMGVSTSQANKPGPLISSLLQGGISSLNIPLTIIPEHLGFKELKTLA